ncbi:MAG: DUF917 domain-containing protein [Bacillota bacterium]
MRTLSLQEIEDVLTGCAILGTGGGGSLERGLSDVRELYLSGKRVNLVSLEEVPDGELVACPYYCGAISPVSPEEEAKFRDFPVSAEPEPIIAMGALAAYLGVSFYGVISTELGGGNTAVAMSCAARCGIPMVDADPAGRSVPELDHTTFFINGVPIYPMAVASKFGDTVVITKVASDARAETLARTVAIMSLNRAGVCSHPVKGGTLKKSVIPGAISHAERIGRALREARAERKDPVEAVRKAGGGFYIFEGVVTPETSWGDRAGFTEGEIAVSGRGMFSGSEARIWYRNEHMVARVDGQVMATIPDLIVVLKANDGSPVINPYATAGMEVKVLGFPAPAEWRTPRGLKCFGPEYLGYTSPYVPIEDRYAGRENAR